MALIHQSLLWLSSSQDLDTNAVSIVSRRRGVRFTLWNVGSRPGFGNINPEIAFPDLSQVLVATTHVAP